MDQTQQMSPQAQAILQVLMQNRALGQGAQQGMQQASGMGQMNMQANGVDPNSMQGGLGTGSVPNPQPPVDPTMQALMSPIPGGGY